CQQGNTYPYSF
nr:immunoglobulin light chain junction region [Macaca mulatta]MOX10549.1 immunoglobulin light chain junction region [Macaca mulatta]